MTDPHVRAAHGTRAAPVIVVFLLGWLAWLLLAGNLAPAEVITGGMVSLLVTWLSGRHLAIYSGIRFTWKAPLHVLGFLLDFLRALVRANLDVARRVLSPSLPIRPAVVEVETVLQSELGRLLLTSAITLTPGTLSIDVRGNRLMVHWIDCPPGADLRDKTRAIIGGFERHLTGFLQ
jgi:multicomponent Na+:H+ antiporter subunit E